MIDSIRTKEMLSWKGGERDRGPLVLTRENYGLDVVILSQLPDEELGQIIREDKLAKGFTGPRDDEWSVVF